jgi:DnaJ-class molecular chaperone
MRVPCPDCKGTGELRIDSENINENFEVEKQTVITECPTCRGLGFIAPGSVGATS